MIALLSVLVVSTALLQEPVAATTTDFPHVAQNQSRAALKPVAPADFDQYRKQVSSNGYDCFCDMVCDPETGCMEHDPPCPPEVCYGGCEFHSTTSLPYCRDCFCW